MKFPTSKFLIVQADGRIRTFNKEDDVNAFLDANIEIAHELEMSIASIYTAQDNNIVDISVLYHNPKRASKSAINMAEYYRDLDKLVNLR